MPGTAEPSAGLVSGQGGRVCQREGGTQCRSQDLTHRTPGWTLRTCTCPSPYPCAQRTRHTGASPRSSLLLHCHMGSAGGCCRPWLALALSPAVPSIAAMRRTLEQAGPVDMCCPSFLLVCVTCSELVGGRANLDGDEDEPIQHASLPLRCSLTWPKRAPPPRCFQGGRVDLPLLARSQAERWNKNRDDWERMQTITTVIVLTPENADASLTS